jgi:hypothetical protein
MPRKKKTRDLAVDLDDVANDKDTIQHTKDLETHLDKVNHEVAELVLYGATPDLAQLSWDLYDKWKKGDLETYFEDDAELKAFYDERKKEMILRMTTFMEVASIAMLDRDKIKGSNLRDLATSLSTVAKVVDGLIGEKNVQQVEHTHKHAVVDAEELDSKLKETRDKLKAVEAEFEELDVTEVDPDDNLDI